jgi:hypothetical protein
MNHVFWPSARFFDSLENRSLCHIVVPLTGQHREHRVLVQRLREAQEAGVPDGVVAQALLRHPPRLENGAGGPGWSGVGWAGGKNSPYVPENPYKKY